MSSERKRVSSEPQSVKKVKGRKSKKAKPDVEANESETEHAKMTAAQDHESDEPNTSPLEPLDAGKESNSPNAASKRKKNKKGKNKNKKSTTNNSIPSASTDDSKEVGKKQEEEEAEQQQQQQKQQAPDILEEEASESDDDELLAAAEAWADKKQENAQEQRPMVHSTSLTPDDLSLHITQLPFDTNELDLRRIFAEHGCAITSIRLVYDRDENGRKTVFRGVAFVDLLNKTSYDKALSLNRKSTIRGRKINIRPTRTKAELANIVTRTRELVKEKIKQQLTSDAKSEPDKNSKKKQKKKEKKEKAKVAKKSQPSSKHKSAAKDTKDVKEGSKQVKGEKEPERKLTKKERNRRAAILMGQKRGKK